MCIRLEVFLPTVEKFLFLYSLRNGCIVIIVWTIARAIFFWLFFVLAILEVLIKEALPCGFLFPKETEALPSVTIVGIYLLYLRIVLAETYLIFGTTELARAMMGAAHPGTIVRFYLRNRTVTWIFETACLVGLTVLHQLLRGWYIGFLFFVVLELYALVVVYSYYFELEDKKDVICPECPEEWFPPVG